ncbi:rab GTPase-binding effector protein 1 isoform X2 [Aethina tumida]|uniref:rab GTPase-binding effector protein 1 isoform X2 n=1 Tax=Aethina tumida TaxID=116153 RepID=UPI0021486FF7|nr:rab GTPase-binding effector protein 1 isoform X2 [Aethina tumida]
MEHTEPPSVLCQNDKEQDEITKLVEIEKQKIQDEFNVQRAKMKELFLQKEAELLRQTEENNNLKQQINNLKRELDDVKSQLIVDSMTRESNFEVEKRKADEEIASLQRVVHETVEESSSTRILYDNELRKLQYYIQQLHAEIAELKTQKQQSPHHTSQEHSSLAPSVVLNALTKGIVKKLGADSFSSQDENSQKGDDVEDLRSLVEPLEDQIKALKEKLRHTDEQLQKCRECGHITDDLVGQTTTSTNTSFDSKPASTCDMCSNYEAQLVKEQQQAQELENRVLRSEKTAERHKEDLLKEIGFRKEMEEKWNEKKEEHKLQVAELTRSTECAEQDLKELRQFFNASVSELQQNIAKLGMEREQIYEELNKLQEENDMLTGKYTVHSEILQSEAINLPDTVEELHELILRNHQELIKEKIGKEAAESKLSSLQSEHVLLKTQIEGDRHEWKSVEDNITLENMQIKKQKRALEKDCERLRNADKAQQAKINELSEQITDLTATIKTLESQNNELKTRAHSLQKELDTTETVQKDFVRLSQSLQMQLEKIRESDTVVRWQHEEDVDECPSCKNILGGGSRKKTHCRHCGQIFCLACLSRTVPSGPNQRPSKVCDVCYTLLVKSSAPYFSEAPPMT